MKNSFFKIHVDKNKYLINYSERGKGKSILFIHGWLHSNEIWSEVEKTISKSYKCIAIDLPGFGNSAPIEKRYISLNYYSRIADRIVKFVSNNYDLRLIVSDSLGALLILELLKSNSIKEIPLIMSGCPVEGLPKKFNLLKTRGLVSFLLYTLHIMPNFLSGFFIKIASIFTIKKYRNINSSLLNGVLNADPITSELLLKEIFDYSSKIKEVYPKNSIVLRGQYDRIIRSSSLKKLSDILGSKYLEISYSGHTPMIENPAEYISAIHEVLRNS